MSTSEENLPNIVTVIKTEPEMEGDLTEEAETDVAFEQIFIKEEVDEEMEFCESVTPGIDELYGIKKDDDEEAEIPEGCAANDVEENVQDFHLNLHSELPVLAVKEEPEQPHNSGTGDVAEKMRSRFLQILRKQSNSSIATREEKLPQDVVSKSTEDTTYILPDDNISDEEEDSIIKDVPNELPRSTTAASIQSRLQSKEEIRVDDYICDICHGGFGTLNRMERHRITHTPNQLLTHACKTCGRLFAKLSSLKVHERFHERPPPVCEVCFRKFKYHCHLKAHQLRDDHKKVKRYTKCDVWKWLHENKSKFMS